MISESKVHSVGSLFFFTYDVYIHIFIYKQLICLILWHRLNKQRILAITRVTRSIQQSRGSTYDAPKKKTLPQLSNARRGERPSRCLENDDRRLQNGVFTLFPFALNLLVISIPPGALILYFSYNLVWLSIVRILKIKKKRTPI